MDLAWQADQRGSQARLRRAPFFPGPMKFCPGRWDITESGMSHRSAVFLNEQSKQSLKVGNYSGATNDLGTISR